LNKSSINPIDAFGNWYAALTQSQQIQIAVHLSYVPGIDINLDLDPFDPVGSVMAFLRQPSARPIELLSRIGLIKTIVDVCFAVPASRNDVEAFGVVSAALLRAQYAARGDEKGMELARLVCARAEKHQDEQVDMYLSWSELVDENGPLSAVSLYNWQFELNGTTSPILPDSEQ
jgi:hypothetical protein